MILFNCPKKRSVTYTVVKRKTTMCLFNRTFIHKVLSKVILKSRINNKLAKTFMFYVKLSYSFDNNVLKSF